MTLPPDFWETRFRAQHTPWERGVLHPSYLAWRADGTLAPCRILVPGAGRSPEPQAMLQDGFDVTTLDLAESAVASQAEWLGADRAVLGDVTTWRPDGQFDAAFDQTCLCALPPALWNGYEESLRHWLRPGGRLFILFMQTTPDRGPPFDCPIPVMRTLFSRWTWPATLADGVAHSNLVGAEIPVVLTLPPS